MESTCALHPAMATTASGVFAKTASPTVNTSMKWLSHGLFFLITKCCCFVSFKLNSLNSMHCVSALAHVQAPSEGSTKAKVPIISLMSLSAVGWQHTYSTYYMTDHETSWAFHVARLASFLVSHVRRSPMAAPQKISFMCLSKLATFTAISLPSRGLCGPKASGKHVKVVKMVVINDTSANPTFARIGSRISLGMLKSLRRLAFFYFPKPKTLKA